MTTSGGVGPVRTLVVDDHPLVRRSLRLACEEEPRIDIVGEAGTGPDALRMIDELAPDVVLLDLVLPGMDGLEVAHELHRREDPPFVIVLTAGDDPEALFDAIRAGVSAYLSKASQPSQIVGSILAVAEGERLFTSEQDARARERLGRLVDEARRGSKLSPREVEIMSLVAEGLTTFEIGRRTGLSPRTVESHLARLYRKLGVKSRTEALARARSLGMLEDDRG